MLVPARDMHIDIFATSRATHPTKLR